MLNHSKTTKLLAVFTLTATTLYMSGCSLFDETVPEGDPTNTTTHIGGTNYSTDDDYQDQKLLDDNGKEYTLHKNADGTETATYADGQEVTFQRDDSGNLNAVSGAAGLLAGLAAGYFLFHGFNSPAGSWDSAKNRYSVSEPLKPASNTSRAKAMKKYTPAGTRIQDIKPPVPQKDDKNGGSATAGSRSISSSNSNSVNKSSSNSSNTSKSSVGSTKSGFGSAGARSASS